MQIDVTSTVTVELREEAFTEEFMQEFRHMFYPFFNKEDHAEHIAQLMARELISPVNDQAGADQFVEGYGPIGKYVRKAHVGHVQTEIQ